MWVMTRAKSLGDEPWVGDVAGSKPRRGALPRNKAPLTGLVHETRIPRARFASPWAKNDAALRLA